MKGNKMYEIIKELSKTDHEPQPFDLEHWILKQRYLQAVANTNKVIRELKNVR